MTYLFEWDFKKALKNISKHSCSFEEATEVFSDPDAIHLEDTKHSDQENRYYVVGKTESGRVLTVRYTARGRVIRIFGAASWRKWRKFYEKNSRSSKDEKN